MRRVATLAFLALLASPAAAQTPAKPALTVGVFEAPPFSMKAKTGTWHGIAVELFEAAAHEMGASYVYREGERNELLALVPVGGVDIVVGPIPVTMDAERGMDFSYMYLTADLALATIPMKESQRWFGVLRTFFSLAFLRVVLVLGALFLIAGWVIWLFERRRNPAQFPNRPWPGIGAGFWWSGVTYSGVGYGDKVPITFGGRVVALAWMLTSVLIVSAFTAAISAQLAISHFEQVRGPEDLPRHVAGVVHDTPAEDYLRRHQVRVRRYDTIAEALAALTAGKVDAVVGGAYQLKYIAALEPDRRMAVSAIDGVEQSYAFALPEGSAIREPLDRALLKVLESPTWREIQFRYLAQ